MWQETNLGTYTQQQESYLDKVGRVWGPILQRSWNTFNTGLEQVYDNTLGRIPDDTMEFVQGATAPGAALIGKGFETAGNEAVKRGWLSPEQAFYGALVGSVVVGGKGGKFPSSPRTLAGMRNNLKQFAYQQRKINPNITPKEITNAFIKEAGPGGIYFEGAKQKVVSGGSTLTKEGLRPIVIQDWAKNQARRVRNRIGREKMGFTSEAAKKNFQALEKQRAVENKVIIANRKKQGLKISEGDQYVSLEHDIAMSHGRRWWQKHGPKANDPNNLFLQRDRGARQFKDNAENWFYPKKGSDQYVIRSNRKNLKDLIITHVDSGKDVLNIKYPSNFKSGLPKNVLEDLQSLLK